MAGDMPRAASFATPYRESVSYGSGASHRAVNAVYGQRLPTALNHGQLVSGTARSSEARINQLAPHMNSHALRSRPSRYMLHAFLPELSIALAQRYSER